jgi:hypothetical protein
MGAWARWRCRRTGHNWFPHVRSEFVVTVDVCLRCRAPRANLPTADCLGGHPLAEHYDQWGDPVAHPRCAGPR